MLKITEKTGEVVGAKAVNDGNEIMMITNEGIVIRMFVDDISVLGRVTLGVKLMNTGNKDDIVVASITKVKESVTQADAEEAERLEAENSKKQMKKILKMNNSKCQMFEKKRHYVASFLKYKIKTHIIKLTMYY